MRVEINIFILEKARVVIYRNINGPIDPECYSEWANRRNGGAFVSLLRFS
jgi:hypothetical protein